jgi:tRNA A-37 threonylcarbamoyl transferase component Bud32
MTSAPDPLNIIGTTIAECRIERFCGNGAAGHVYEATQRNRRVAMKIYKEWLFEQDAAAQDARIERESDIRRIDHPNVCKVFGHGRVMLRGIERRYLVMEFIDGDSLDAAIRSGLFRDWRAFVDAALQLVAGLAALHAAESVHRDIKPANIMLERTTGRLVVTDFGVVADLEATTLLTQGHEFLGTIHYAAPEWLYRQPQEAAHHPAVDVYSLGATFLEMATGDAPFGDIRNRHQLAEAVRRQIPSVNTPPSYPREIASVVREMLAKAPEMRPTLQQIRSALERASDLATSAESGHTDADPFEQYRRMMAGREDVRRVAERERFKKARWGTFEPMWTKLADAWRWEDDAIASLPGVIETTIYWRGEEPGTNTAELKKSFPDRQWTWSRSFLIRVAPPATGVECCYVFHGYEDAAGTGITRFVATDTLTDHPQDWPHPDQIQIDTAESWMGTLEAALNRAIDDVPVAKRLLVELLVATNARS